MPDPPAPARNSTRGEPPKASRFVWIVGALLVLGIVGVVLLIRSQRLPRLDRARFDAAKAVWNENRKQNYEITISVSGRQPGVYAVRVEQGIATAATLNGNDLRRPRIFGTWSVDGMFDTISSDLDSLDSGTKLLLGAEFDETLGVPLRYERLQMQTGVQYALQWEVTRFGEP